MAAQYHSLFTTQGLALLREAIQTGAKLGITHMAYGDGNGIVPTPNADFTKLVREVYRAPLNRLAPSKDNQNWLEADGVIPSAVGGFNIREVGLYAGDILVAYANYPATYKPSADQGTAQIKTIRIVLQIDNTANFELKIDASVVMATIQSVEEAKEDIKQYTDQTKVAHLELIDSLKDVEPKNGNIIYIKETQAHYVYDESQKDVNNAKVYNGWVLQQKRKVKFSDFPFIIGELDDTNRFSRALSTCQRFDSVISASGYTQVPMTELILEAGSYKVSDTIQVGEFISIVSNGNPAIHMTDNTKPIFSFKNAYASLVFGISFHGGLNAIYFENNNTDATTLHVDRCEFHAQNSYSIKTHGTTSASDTHLSTLLEVNRSKFIKTKGMIYNNCDKAIVRTSWFYPSYENFTQDTAWIFNKSGHLKLEDNLGVPVMGGKNWDNIPRVSKARWIDNYGDLLCDGTRFGMESDGMVIVHSYGGISDNDNMGSSIIIKNCQTSAGVQWSSGNDECGIIKIMDKIPRLIVIEDNYYQLGCPALVVNDKSNLFAYLEENNTTSYLDRKIDIRIGNNMAWGQDYTGGDYPHYLSQFVNKGSIDPTLSPVRLYQVDRDVGGASEKTTNYKFPLPLQSSAATYLVTISGDQNLTGSHLYRLSKTFILCMQTAYDGINVVRFLTHQDLTLQAIPEGISIIGSQIEFDYWFGDQNTGTKVENHPGTLNESYFTINIKNVNSALINIIPLHLGLYDFGTNV